MKIGIDAKTLTRDKYTGISYYLFSILEEISKQNNKDEFYLFTHKNLNLPNALSPNFKTVKIKGRWGSLTVMFKLKRVIKDLNIDVFWGPEHCLPLNVKHIPLIMTVHDLAIYKIRGVGKFLNTIYMKTSMSIMIRKSSRIIAISESTKLDVVEKFNINKDKVEVIYISTLNDKSITNTNNHLEVLNFYQLERYFIFISTIEPRKNVLTLIKAFETFQQFNSDYKLVIVGGWGWKYKKVQDYLAKSSIKEKIVLTGYVTSLQKEALLSHAVAFVFPSLYEGFGLPLLEALNHGIPTITTNVSSLPEVGGNASYYLDNPLDYKGLSLLMKEISLLTEEQKEKIKSLSILQSQKFTIQKCAKETYHVIIDIVK